MFNIGDKVFYSINSYSDALNKGLVVGKKISEGWNNKTEYVIEYEAIIHPDSTERTDVNGRYYLEKGKGVKTKRYITKTKEDLFTRDVK